MKIHASRTAHALRSIARNQQIKSYIRHSNELYPLLLKAAKRYIAGEYQRDAIKLAEELTAKNYFISIEYIGENTTDLEDYIKVKDQFFTLIEKMGSMSMIQTISFDLSHIGLSVNQQTAFHHLLELAEKANEYGITLMISMEESTKTDAILDIYKKTSLQYANVGITIQACLYRSKNDIQELIHYPGKIRIVKGAFQESDEMALPRSKELDDRYLEMVEYLMKANHPVSIATHDEKLIREMENRKFFHHPHAEMEMLYGIRPDLLRNLKNNGYKCRVYLTYGKEWYLYLCHRIAEYPENVYHAVTDMINPSVTEKSGAY